MKRIWVATSILLALFVATFFHSTVIATFSENLSMILEEAESYAESDDWDGAKKLTEVAQQKWQSRDLYLHITLRHNETDAVFTGFGEVLEFIECQEAGEYSAANARLIAELNLLAEAEQLLIKNIL